MKAPVNRIIPFSNVDGPGNRMAIFFQSCPFSCMYCHNPETIHMCLHCGKCIETCPVHALEKNDGKVIWKKEICVNCDTCIKTCPHLSSPKITYMEVEEVVNQIMEAKPFIKGITVSGGECMNHADFLLELFTRVKAMGLTCFIDSNGYYDFKKYPALMDVCDAIMLDVKAYDSSFHKELTGKDNQTVLDNLQYLLDINKLYEVRTVLLNDEVQNKITVEHVSRIIQDKCFYKLIKYRPFGVRKEGIEFCGENIVSNDVLEEMTVLARANGASKIKKI